MTTGEALFGGIVNARRSSRSRLLGAALGLAAWTGLWAWALAGVAAPLGSTLRSGAGPVVPAALPVVPAADVVSRPPIAPAPCAC